MWLFCCFFRGTRFFHERRLVVVLGCVSERLKLRTVGVDPGVKRSGEMADQMVKSNQTNCTSRETFLSFLDQVLFAEVLQV